MATAIAALGTAAASAAAGAGTAAAGTAAAGTAATAAGTAATAAGTAASAGSLLSTGAMIADLAGAGMGVMSAIEQNKAERAQERAVKQQAHMDAVAVQNELSKTLASNRVAAATSGLESAGSMDYAQKASKVKASQQMRVIGKNAGTRTDAMKQRRRTSLNQSLLNAGGQAITAGSQMQQKLKQKTKVSG